MVANEDTIARINTDLNEVFTGLQQSEPEAI